MDQRAILDKGSVPDSTLPESQRDWPGVRSNTESPAGSGEVKFPGEDGGKSLAEMAQRDLVATLQLLTERAQYITGATGAAIALRDGSEMTCRASAGMCAPDVGAQLQVDSGLSGESVRTQQTLRCDDAATDPRVNRESCEALGIASVVVMPLVQGSEVIGVFELFSDKAHAFEARDITALERMGAMVFTALENALAALKDVASAAVTASQKPHATPENATAAAPTFNVTAHESNADGSSEEQTGSAPESVAIAAHETSISEGPVIVLGGSTGFTFHAEQVDPVPVNAAPAIEIPLAPQQQDEADILEDLAGPVIIPSARGPAGQAASQMVAPQAEADILELPSGGTNPGVMATPSTAAQDTSNAISASAPEINTVPASEPPSAIASLRRCESCGFPVSEGRQLCLDCERKQATAGGSAVTKSTTPDVCVHEPDPKQNRASLAAPINVPAPTFLRDELSESSWIARNKLLVIAGVIVVAASVGFWLLR